MKIEKIKINNIPSIAWREKVQKYLLLYIEICLNKEDEVIKYQQKKL